MGNRRSIRGTTAGLGVGFLGLALASCAAPNAPVGSQTQLEITIRADGTRVSEQYTLECSGEQASESSTLPDASKACLTLEQSPSILTRATDPDQACTEIYGGPQRAKVSGILQGESVDLAFSRHNGCAIERWDTATILLGDANN